MLAFSRSTTTRNCPEQSSVFVLVLLELIAMYLQARNASETEMDKRLGVASHRNKDDVAK